MLPASPDFCKSPCPLCGHSSQLTYANSSRHGWLRRSVPSMPMPVAVVCFLLNCLVPGIGTLIASFATLFGCTTGYGKEGKCQAFFLGLAITITQVTTAIFVVGWVWSVMWGVNFIKRKFLLFFTYYS